MLSARTAHRLHSQQLFVAARAVCSRRAGSRSRFILQMRKRLRMAIWVRVWNPSWAGVGRSGGESDGIKRGVICIHRAWPDLTRAVFVKRVPLTY